MSRASRRYAQRLSNYYGRREDESGNGECFASTYRQTMGMSPVAQPAQPAAKTETAGDPRIARAQAEIAKYEAKAYLTAGDKDQLAFYRSLLATLTAGE